MKRRDALGVLAASAAATLFKWTPAEAQRDECDPLPHLQESARAGGPNDSGAAHFAQARVSDAADRTGVHRALRDRPLLRIGWPRSILAARRRMHVPLSTPTAKDRCTRGVERSDHLVAEGG